MPKTADTAPLPMTFTAPEPADDLNIRRASLRAWRVEVRPRVGPQRGRPCIHDVSAWEPGTVANVEPRDLQRLMRAARRRGYVVTQLGPARAYRLA